MAYKTTRTPELHQPMDGLMKITLVWSLGASLGYTTWRAMRRAAQTNTNVSLKVLSGGQRTEPGVAQLHLQVCSSVHENPARAPRRPQHPTHHINCKISVQTRTELDQYLQGILSACSAALPAWPISLVLSPSSCRGSAWQGQSSGLESSSFPLPRALQLH